MVLGDDGHHVIYKIYIHIYMSKSLFFYYGQVRQTDIFMFIMFITFLKGSKTNKRVLMLLRCHQ